MTNYAKLNHENKTIVMDRTFAKNADIVGSPEYNMIQACRKDYPHYQVITRRIKTNPNKESYDGLTYQYMEDYILTHEPKETREEVLEEFQEMRLISACHSRAFRYPTIKKWFLKRYPAIKEFGVIAATANTNSVSEVHVAA